MIINLISIDNDENSNQDNYYELKHGEKFNYQPKRTGKTKNQATMKKISRGSS